MSLAAQLAPAIRRDAATKFGRAVRIVDDRLDKTAPVKTGRLKRSRRTRLSTAGDLLSADIDYQARSRSGGGDYGEFLDEGVRPHVIRPRRAKVLRFVVGGRVVYARKVNHPGTNKHRGWFSRPTSSTDWRLVLDQVFPG